MLLTETADLYLYDRATGMFMVQERAVQATLWLVEGQKFPCWLSIAGEGGQTWVSTSVSNDMPLTFSEVRWTIRDRTDGAERALAGLQLPPR